MNLIRKLLFKDPIIIPWSKSNARGFLSLGNKYIHYSELTPQETAIYNLSAMQKTLFLVLILVIILGLVINWVLTVIIVIGILTTIYFGDLFFDLYLIIKSFNNSPEIAITQEELAAINKKLLPKYTIISPFYKESAILPQYINAMKILDYPKNKLQILIILEEDDVETIAASKDLKLPSNFEVRIVPQSVPKTKPKALNFGLLNVTGEYVVVYDAEDIPEKDQLKKAVLAFQKSDTRVKCIQAKLNYYNPQRNILTRLFTAEYSLWFDLILPGIQSISGPIPLGGSSNHFHRKYLEELKAWDSFNVTEDCDLGIRLAKKGYSTAIIQSTTYEEATENFNKWFWQRTRWIKGYLQTYLVHMRRPNEFFGNGKRSDLITFQFIVGGKIALMYINPIMWFLTICYFILRNQIGSQFGTFFPTPILYMGLFSLFIGNFLYLYYYMVGCARREYWSLVNFVILVPVYWLMMSAAAYVALYKLLTEPHYWAKTSHRLIADNFADILFYEKDQASKLK